MPIGPARMPLFDHLGELRRRLTIVVVSVFAAAIVLYFATPVVLDILEDPIRSFVPDGKFYITTTLGGFGLRFSLAIKMAVVMCTPMIIWQILAFFLPALRPNERKWVVPTVLASTVLFFLGAIFCYFIIIPAGFEWQPWRYVCLVLERVSSRSSWSSAFCCLARISSRRWAARSAVPSVSSARRRKR